jgi:hypothetical protein
MTDFVRNPLYEKLWTGNNEIACCECGHSITLHHVNNMIEEEGLPYVDCCCSECPKKESND